MKRLLLLIIATWAAVASAEQSSVGPCYWAGQYTKCFPSLGVFLDSQKALYFGDATTNSVAVQAPSAVTSYTLVLPGSPAAVGQMIQNDGAGNLSWANSVTSLAFTGPGGIFGVSGSPVSGSGTIAETVTGTSGGVPYFSTTSQLSSSAQLTSGNPVLGGGAGVAPSTATAGPVGAVLQQFSTGASYAAVNLASTAAVTGTLPASRGGTGGPGTNGQALVTSGGAVTWSTLSPASVTAGTANGQVLTTSGGAVSWGFPSAAAVIGTLTASQMTAASTGTAGTVSYEDSGLFAVTVSGPATYALNIYYSRVGKSVTLNWGDVTGTNCTVSTSFTGTAQVPSALRPTQSTLGFWVGVQDAGATVNQPGRMNISTAGTIQIFKDITGNSFTGNTTACGFYKGSAAYTTN